MVVYFSNFHYKSIEKYQNFKLLVESWFWLLFFNSKGIENNFKVLVESCFFDAFSYSRSNCKGIENDVIVVFLGRILVLVVAFSHSKSN